MQLYAARSIRLFALLTLSLAGCLGKSPDITLGVTTQRQLWQSNNAKNYTYVSSHSCECVPNFAGPLRVTVRNNVVTAIVIEPSGQVVPSNYRTTIDGLFDLIDSEYRSRPSLLEVTYHASLGYPTRVKYGTPENDGGGIITVTSLTVNP